MNTISPPQSISAAGPPTLLLTWRARAFLLFVVLLIAAFGKPMLELFRFAASNGLYSHIPLIPAVGLYLLWLKRGELPCAAGRPSLTALLPLVAALGFLVLGRAASAAAVEDYYAWLGLSFLGFLHAGVLLLLGWAIYRHVAFPLGFLVFALPMHVAVREQVTAFLQHGSADAAELLLRLSGIPLLREGTLFRLPGFVMEVAPQCSGIHSSLALLITSVLAGYLLLRTARCRWLLVLVVVPLALLRNALRIFTIGQLCVLISPDMVHSFIHTRGGPIFFAFSLVPFLGLLVFLKWIEGSSRKLTATKH